MDIREGCSGFEGAIAAIFIAARATMPYLPDVYSAEETRYYLARQLDEHASLVALEAGTPLGFAIIGFGWLHHLYVRERNRGVGSILLEGIKRRSEHGLQLWTFQANEGARRFYERHGFTVMEATDGTRNAERLPDLRYEWHPGGLQSV